jgi:hypothetical protein
MARHWKRLGFAALMAASVSATGCFHSRNSLWNRCNSDDCCSSDCDDDDGCGSCCGRMGYWTSLGFCHRRSGAIPQTLPLGSTVRSHYQVMQTNAEASDFIIHQHEFMAETAQLTPDGKDHILEIAARMRSAPFPVLVERTWNNADPELDAHRRNLVATILTDLGNPDAQQRTVVATSYGPGYNDLQAEPMYYQHVMGGSGFGGGFGTYGNNMGTYGGFGGGAGGGVGFGP